MDWFGAKRLWAGLTARRTAARETDYADMGTTVGLDASLARPDADFSDTDPSLRQAGASWEDRLGGRGAH